MTNNELTLLRELMQKYCKTRIDAPDSECREDGACDECHIQTILNELPSDATPAMTTDRVKQIAFQLIQLLRKTTLKNFTGGQKDADDWLFSELDLEIGELTEIVAPYNITVYAGSCFEDGQSPKDYDKKHFLN